MDSRVFIIKNQYRGLIFWMLRLLDYLKGILHIKELLMFIFVTCHQFSVEGFDFGYRKFKQLIFCNVLFIDRLVAINAYYTMI